MHRRLRVTARSRSDGEPDAQRRDRAVAPLANGWIQDVEDYLGQHSLERAAQSSWSPLIWPSRQP